MNYLSKYSHIVPISPAKSVVFNSLFMEGILVEHPNCKTDDLSSKLISVSDQNLAVLKSAHIISNIFWDENVKKICKERIAPPRINTCVLVLTEKCNLRCRYCFIEKNLSCRTTCDSMSTEVASQAIEYFSKQVSNNDIVSIILYGGEPLMNFDAISIIINTIKKLQKQNKLPSEIHISINTNGTLITEEIAKYFSDHNVTVSISIDGNRFHNRDRVYPNNKESFDDVIKGLKICRNNHVKYGISITATPDLLKNYKDCIDFVKNLNPLKVGINPLLAAGELYPEYGRDFCDMMIYAKKVLNECEIEEDRLTDRLIYLKSRCIRYHDCSAAKGEQIVITPDGSVGICHEFIGSRDFFISDIWSDDLLSNNAELNNWTLRTPILTDECQNCMALGICGGGCPANAYNIYGDLMKIDKNCCGTSKRLVEWYFREYAIPKKSITIE